MDKQFLRVLALFILGIFAIMTHSAVWNSIADGDLDKYFILPSVVSFIAEGLGIYWLATHWANRSK